MVNVSHVSKSFGYHSAVSDVSFELSEGEVAVLLGPNGAGKTTTMRIMAGYYVPDEGDVTMNGVSVLSDPVAVKRMIGYLPESNPLYRDMLVSEYLLFCARMMEMPSAKLGDAFARVVHETGIDEVFYRPISELSKGYRQRVGLAGALIADPSVLILDEPTEGLDPNQRTDMRSLLGKLAHDKTVLVSTHVLSEAQQLASRVIILNRGTVASAGTVDELIDTQGGTRFVVDLEGEQAARVVSSLPAASSVDLIGEHHGRVQLSVLTNEPSALPRQLSSAIAAHKFVVWRLAEESGGLERAFADITRGELTGRVAQQPRAPQPEPATAVDTPAEPEMGPSVLKEAAPTEPQTEEASTNAPDESTARPPAQPGRPAPSQRRRKHRNRR